MSPLETWLLAAALHFAPPERAVQFPGHEETLEQARTRYAAIAHDVAAAVDGRKDAHSAAALALAFAIGETRIAHDADVGPCYREGVYKLRCDAGAAAGLWQLHAYYDRDAGERVSVAMIFADRARTARFVVRQLSRSWTSCKHLAPEDRLSGFGLGSCKAGNASVRARYKLWLAVRAWKPKAEPSS